MQKGKERDRQINKERKEVDGYVGKSIDPPTEEKCKDRRDIDEYTDKKKDR